MNSVTSVRNYACFHFLSSGDGYVVVMAMRAVLLGVGLLGLSLPWTPGHGEASLSEPTQTNVVQPPVPPSLRVEVLGHVLHPGDVEIMANEKLTVSQAIAKAGGFADFADNRRVKLLREKPDGTTEVLIVDVKAFLTGQSLIDPVVQAGDRIGVRSKLGGWGGDYPF